MDLIDTPDNIEPVSIIFQPLTTEHESGMGDQIATLWSAHVNAKRSAKSTNEELRAIRAKLGRQLHEMKSFLAKPGRGGQWSSFLEQRNIPRATADRLVARHQMSLDPDANRLTEPVCEPTEAEVQKLFTHMWPKLRRTLRSQQSVELFVHLLTSSHQHSAGADQSNPGGLPSAEMCRPHLPAETPSFSAQNDLPVTK